MSEISEIIGMVYDENEVKEEKTIRCHLGMHGVNDDLEVINEEDLRFIGLKQHKPFEIMRDIKEHKYSDESHLKPRKAERSHFVSRGYHITNIEGHCVAYNPKTKDLLMYDGHAFRPTEFKQVLRMKIIDY